MPEKLIKVLTTILLSVLCLATVTVMFAPALSAISVIGNIFFDIIKENTEEAEKYVKGENNITNALGESYTVKYKETCGFPDHFLKIEISANSTLLTYSTKFKGLGRVPKRVLHLFRKSGTEYYFAGSDNSEFIFAYDTRARRGERLNFDERGYFTGEYAEHILSGNLEIAETLRRNINRDALREKSRKCGYDDTFVLKVYDYGAPRG